MKHSNTKNIFSLITFMLLFGHANAQNRALVDTCDKKTTKTENVNGGGLNANVELKLTVNGNMSQTYNGTHMDLLPMSYCKVDLNINQLSVFAVSKACFSSVPSFEQKYKLLNGELCFGIGFKCDDNNKVTVKFGKFGFAGKYGLAAHTDKFTSTDLLYDMFTINSDRSLNRGGALIYNHRGFNVACGYTEQDGKGGLAFNGKNANVLVTGGYDGKVVSAQFTGFYSIKDKNFTFNFYAMCTPNDNNMFICKTLGGASEKPVFEIAYFHKFSKSSTGTVMILDNEQFTNFDITCMFPCGISINVGAVNKDPYFENAKLSPKIGIGYYHQFINAKTH